MIARSALATDQNLAELLGSARAGLSSDFHRITSACVGFAGISTQLQVFVLDSLGILSELLALVPESPGFPENHHRAFGNSISARLVFLENSIKMFPECFFQILIQYRIPRKTSFQK